MTSFGRKLLFGGFLSLSMLFSGKAAAQQTPEDSIRHAEVNKELIDQARQDFRRLAVLGETTYSKELDSLSQVFTKRILMNDTAIVSRVVYLDGNKMAIAAALGFPRATALDSLFAAQDIPRSTDQKLMDYILDEMTQPHYSPYGGIIFTQDPYMINLSDVRTSVITSISDHAVDPAFKNKYISYTMNNLLINLHEGWHTQHTRYTKEMLAQDTSLLKDVNWNVDSTVAANPLALERASLFSRREAFADLGALCDMVKTGFSADIIDRHARWRQTGGILHLSSFALEALKKHIDSVGIEKFRAMTQAETVTLCYDLADRHGLSPRGWKFIFSNNKQRQALQKEFPKDADIAKALHLEDLLSEGQEIRRLHASQTVDMEVMQKLSAPPEPTDEMTRRAFKDHGIVTPETMIMAFRDLMNEWREKLIADPNNSYYMEKMTRIRTSFYMELDQMDYVATNKTFGLDISDMMTRAEKKEFARNFITEAVLLYPHSADSAKNAYSAYLDSLEKQLNRNVVPAAADTLLTKVAVIDPVELDVALALGIDPHAAIEMMAGRDSLQAKRDLLYYLEMMLNAEQSTPDSSLVTRTQNPVLLFNELANSAGPALLVPFDPAVSNGIGSLTLAEETEYVNRHESWHLRDGKYRLARNDWEVLNLLGRPVFEDAAGMDAALRFYAARSRQESLADVGAVGDMIRNGHGLHVIGAVAGWRKSMPTENLDRDAPHMTARCLEALENKIKSIGIDNFRKLEDKTAHELYFGIVDRHGQTAKSLEKSIAHDQAKKIGKLRHRFAAVFSKDMRKGIFLAKTFANANDPVAPPHVPPEVLADKWDALEALQERAFKDARIVTPETVIAAYGRLQDDLTRAASNDNAGRALNTHRLLKLREAFIENLRTMPYADINMKHGLSRTDMKNYVFKRNSF